MKFQKEYVAYWTTEKLLLIVLIAWLISWTFIGGSHKNGCSYELYLENVMKEEKT